MKITFGETCDGDSYRHVLDRGMVGSEVDVVLENGFRYDEVEVWAKTDADTLVVVDRAERVWRIPWEQIAEVMYL